MVSLFNIPTLNLCALVASLLVAALMMVNWRCERKSTEVAFWAFGYGCVAMGNLLQALRGIVPETVGAGGGVLFLMAGVGLIWVGFRAFDNFSWSYWGAFWTSLIWVPLYFGLPQVFSIPNNRIALFSFLFVSQLAMIMWSVWCGWKQERLPARILIIAMGGTYCLLTALRVPLSILYPVSEVNGASPTPWFGVVMFILYCNGLGLGFGVFALGRERSLRQYKYASEIDMLTGALNRRAFYDQVGGRFAATGGAIALIDIDHFKRVNDGYGHAGGDAVLRSFTQTVLKEMTDDMIFCRMGGEEFGLFIPASRGDLAKDFCETVRRVVSQTPITWRDQEIRITISVGICEDLDGTRDLEAALMQADVSLYLAKNQGRDCVVAGSGLGDVHASRSRETDAMPQGTAFQFAG